MEYTLLVGDHVVVDKLAYGTRIPDGKLLVLGDSRGNSRDGRVFGLIDHEVIYGKAMGVFYRRGEGFVWKAL
jgi:signal peptidase I